MDSEESNCLTTSVGDLELPIGFRFIPTDQELVGHYLRVKVQGLPLPASVITEYDVFQTEPYGLPGDLKEKMYFFSIRNENAQRVRWRVAGSGYWISTRKDKQITDSQTNQIVATRKTMIFYEADNKRNINRTRWIMHELSLVSSRITTSNPNLQVNNEVMEDWVVYRIFQKKRRASISRSLRIQHFEERLQQILEETRPCVIDLRQEHFNGDEYPPPPPSPSCT